MFPSSGYFRSITCPYFANGLCERPHCHFRHVKSDPPAPTQPPRATFDIGPTLSSLESVMGRGSEKPDLLMLVREAVRQVQKEVEEDRAKLNTGVTPTIESKATQNGNENLIAGDGHLKGKTASKSSAASSSSSTLPEYRPTPISELKKLQETQKPIVASSVVSSLEYDPTEGYSPSTSKSAEVAEYRPSVKIPYVPAAKPKPKVRVEYVPKPIGSSGLGADVPFCRDSDDDDDADVIGNEPLESTFSDDDTVNAQITKENTESTNETDKTTLSEVKNFDLVNMILTESKMCDSLISAASARKESQTSVKTVQAEKLQNKSSNSKKLATTSKVKVAKSELKNVSSDRIKSSSDKQCTSSKSSTSKKDKTKSHENKGTSESKTSATSKSNTNKTNSSSKSPKSVEKVISKDVSKSSKHGEQVSVSQKVSSASHKKSKTSTLTKLKDADSHQHVKDKHNKHTSSSSTKNTKESSKDTGRSPSKTKDKHSDVKKKKEIKSSTKNGKIKTPDKKLGSKSHDNIKSPLSSCESSKGVSHDEIATGYSSPSVYDDLDTDLDEHDINEECLRIFNEYVPEEPDQSSQKKMIEKPKPEEDYSVGKKRVAHEQCGSAVKKPKLAANIQPAPSLVMYNRFIQMQKMMQEAQEKARAAMPPPASVPGVQSAFLSTVHLANTGKKRIAHVPNVKALLSAQKPVSEGIHPQQSSQALQAEATPSQSDAPHATAPSLSGPKITKGVPRVAHTPTITNLQRPMIPPEFGNRVPINIRQRYLNLLIDECLKIYDTEQDAFDRALAEEKNSYDRSSTRTVYLNVVANTIKRLRSEKEGILPVSSPPPQETKSTPASSNAVKSIPRSQQRTLSHEFVLGGKKAMNTSYSIERHKNKTNDAPLTPLKLYQALEIYILTKEQLQENGYPVQDPSDSSRIVIMKKDSKQPKLTDSLEKVCDRCGARFCVNYKGIYLKQDECFYHWGRPYKVRSLGTIQTQYSCCQGGSHSEGCSVAKLHVFKDSDTESLRGYVHTLPKSPRPDVYYGVYALDCEMCYTTMGMELTRITVIGQDLNTVYESLVKPENPVVDYNTRFSGIMEGDLDDVKTSLRDVQAVLLSIFNNKTILIGHSLESDFKALKLVHNTVVDTSIVFPHRLGPPYKRALRNLTAEYLKKIIQNDVDGHDSKEDAASCMELMLWKVKEDQKKC